MSKWKAIKSFRGEDWFDKVDLWLNVPASPRSMGFSDAWRVPECWRRGGKWFHYHEGKEAELDASYITHWMPMPDPPKVRA